MYNYFIELRNRSFLLSITWSSSFICAYSYKEVLIFDLAYQNSCADISFIFLTFSEIMYSFGGLSFFISNQMLFPVFLSQIFAFLGFAFSKKEFFIFKKFLSFTLWVWLFSFLFCYAFLSFFIFNLAFEFFSSLQLKFYFEPKLLDYLAFLFFFINFSTCCFQVFNVLVFTFLILNIPFLVLKKLRKFFYLCLGLVFFFLFPFFDLGLQTFVFLGILFFLELLLFWMLFHTAVVKVKH